MTKPTDITPALEQKPTRGLAYSIPIRPGFLAQLVLPYDLSGRECAQLKALLDTLVMPNA